MQSACQLASLFVYLFFMVTLKKKQQKALHIFEEDEMRKFKDHVDD